ncbi:MAG: hypothetical protein IKP28_01605 [Clostridia bacterium]|nr:hypothetical protein [Clostridia bacterium]
MILGRDDIPSEKKLDNAKEIMEKSNNKVKEGIQRTKKAKDQNEKKRIVEETVKNAILDLENALTGITEFGDREMEREVNSLIDQIKGDAVKIAQEKETNMMKKLQEMQEMINETTEKVKKKSVLFKQAEAKNQGLVNDLIRNFDKTEKGLNNLLNNNTRGRRVLGHIASTNKTSGGGGGLRTLDVDEFLDLLISNDKNKDGFDYKLVTSVKTHKFNWSSVITDWEGGANSFFIDSRNFLYRKGFKGGRYARSYDKAFRALKVDPEVTYARLMSASYSAAGGDRGLAAAYMALTHHQLLASELRNTWNEGWAT